MALRGTAQTPYSAGGSSWSITPGIAIQAGDTIILAVTPGTSYGSDPISSWPTGFSPIPGLPDTGIQGASGRWLCCAQKTATDSEPASYTIHMTGGGTGSIHCRVYDQDSGTVTATSLTSSSTIGQPATFTATGVTANPNDDVVVFYGFYPSTSNWGTVTLFTPGGSFANGLLTTVAGQVYPALASMDYTGNPGGPTGSITASYTDSNGEAVHMASFVLSLTNGPPPTGAIPTPGPGVSPSLRNQFFVPVRDTSAGQGLMYGQSYAVSSAYGSALSASTLTGLSYSVSTAYGQAGGTGNLPGVSYAVSISYGQGSQSSSTSGAIPGAGPGISPASMFMFSSLALDETLFKNTLARGLSGSVSTAYGAMRSAAAMGGESFSVSTAYGLMSTGLTGVSYSVSFATGNLTAPTIGQLAGLSVSVSGSYGNLGVYTPPVTTCVDLWSADGRLNWTADGFTGWSADGYEPTPLACAVTFLASAGVNVGTLSYAYSLLVPAGYVITGYVPFINPALAGQYIPLLISKGPPPAPTIYTVPNVVGAFYYDAQLAILDAGFYTAYPTWAFGQSTSSLPPVTIDSTVITIDSTIVTIDGFAGVKTTTTLPQYVLTQSVPAGTTFTQPVQITIVVAGFPVTNQPGIVVPVP